MSAAPPLAGIRFLDFYPFLAGPYAARALADLGTDLIRIEVVLGYRADRVTREGCGASRAGLARAGA